jgi:hypothetical protein
MIEANSAAAIVTAEKTVRRKGKDEKRRDELKRTE